MSWARGRGSSSRAWNVSCARGRASMCNHRTLSLIEHPSLAHHFWNKHILDHGHKFASHFWQKVRGAHEAQRSQEVAVLMKERALLLAFVGEEMFVKFAP